MEGEKPKCEYSLKKKVPPTGNAFGVNGSLDFKGKSLIIDNTPVTLNTMIAAVIRFTTIRTLC